MAGISERDRATELCVTQGCSNPRDGARRICRACYNGNRRDKRRVRNGQHVATLDVNRAAAVLIRNFLELGAREGGVRGLADDLRAIEDRNLIDKGDGGGTITDEQALEQLAKTRPRIHAIIAQMDSMTVEETEDAEG